MATLNVFEHLLPTLSRCEKAQILLRWVVRDLGDDFPGIDSRPDVCVASPGSYESRSGCWGRRAG